MANRGRRSGRGGSRQASRSQIAESSSIAISSQSAQKVDDEKEIEALRAKKKLTSTEEFRLIQLLSKFEDSTATSFAWSDGFRRWFHVLFLISIPLLILELPDVVRRDNAAIATFTCLIILSSYCYVRQMRPPIEKNRRANWFDFYGRFFAVLYALGPISLAVLGMPLVPGTKQLLSIGCVAIFLHGCILLAVLFWPHLLISKKITALGSFLGTCGIVAGFNNYIIWRDDYSTAQHIILTIITGLMAIMLQELFTVNTIERLSFQIIRPDKLFVAIKKIHSELGETQAALDLMSDLISEGKFGVIAELNRELTRRYAGGTSRLWSIAMAIVITIMGATAGAVYEGLIQGSAPYNRLRSFICANVNWMCADSASQK